MLTIIAIIFTLLALGIVSGGVIGKHCQDADKTWVNEFRHWIHEKQIYLTAHKCAVITVPGWNAVYIPTRDELSFITMMHGLHLPVWAEMAILVPHPATMSENVWRGYIMHEVKHMEQYLAGQFNPEHITFLTRARMEFPAYKVTYTHLAKDVGQYHATVFCICGLIESILIKHLVCNVKPVIMDFREAVEDKVKALFR